jgi:hypothetical protein
VRKNDEIAQYEFNNDINIITTAHTFTFLL